MNCDSKKICGWIQTLAQLTVAAVILYVGYAVQTHMERMVNLWEDTALAVQLMQQDVHEIQVSMTSMDDSVKQMNATMLSMDKRVWELNNRMGGVQRRMSPMGWMMP